MLQIGKSIGCACAVCLAAALLGGCGVRPQASAGQTATAEPVTLSYYYPCAPQQDLQTVQNAMNAILKKTIHAQIRLVPVDLDQYDQKMQMMVSAQENFDLCFTSSQRFSYVRNASDGAFADLTELLPERAPKLWVSLPSSVWDAAKVNGRVFAAVNQQIFAQSAGFVYNRAAVERYKIDCQSIRTPEQFVQTLVAIKQKAPASETGLMTWGADWLVNLMKMNGWESVGSSSVPGAAASLDPSPRVFNEYATPVFHQLVTLGAEMRRYGVIPPDLLTASSLNRSQMVGFLNNITPSSRSTIAQQYGWADAVEVPLARPVLTTGGITGTMTAVSATSAHPETAVAYLEQINTDRKLYNLLSHGIEGVHYDRTGTAGYAVRQDSRYAPGRDWEFGNQFNSLVPLGSADDVWTQTAALNGTAAVSRLLGFVYNDTRVKSEETDCAAVVSKYYLPFTVGVYGDATETVYRQFLSELEAAGVDKIIADEQAQLDAFLAAKQ